MNLSAEVESILPPDQAVRTSTKLQGNSPEDYSVTYAASYFSQYDPLTALDMLDRIPGIDGILPAETTTERGLGAGDGAILIDGKRVAGKSNSGKDMLGRIAAQQVDYFQIVRGNSADLNVRSAGPVVNVVMKEGAARPSISAEIRANIHQNGTTRPDGAMSLGGQSGALNYLLSYTAESYYEHRVREEYSVYADSTPKDFIVQAREREQTDHKLAGNFGYQFDDNKRLQIDTLYLDNSAPHELQRTITDFNVDPVRAVFEWEDRKSDRHKWEFGGNYEHIFADQTRFNFTFIFNDETDDWFYERFKNEGATASKTLYVGENKRTRERIIRASYKAGLTAGHDVELGVEGAQTILDKSFHLASAGSGAASPRFGGLAPVTEVASTVEEMRYEPFIVHNWDISQVAALESALVVELSEIEQQGRQNGLTVGKAREFEFLKPKLDYRHELSSVAQLRASLERHVSQLSFSNFSASNNNDLDKNVSAGNPNLEQEKSWRYEVNLEYRLPDDAGVLNSRFFYHDIEDVIDRVAVSVDPTQPVSAPGNIGDGKRYGAELDASLRLKAFDLPDALLTAGALVQDSAVVDPFLGEERRLHAQSRGEFSLGVRHDVSAWKFNYGADYTYYFAGDRRVDIDDLVTYQMGPSASIFVEKAAFKGVTVRLESSNLLNTPNCYDGTRYQGAIGRGVVREREDYCYSYGRKTALMVKTTF